MFGILLILIFIRPFISSLASPYENLIYSILLLGALVIWIMLRGLHLDKIRPIRYPLILFILALAVSLISSPNITISVQELYKYVIGLSLLAISVSLSGKEKKRVILCIVLAGLVISFRAIYQYFFGFQNLLNYVAKKGISDSFVLDYISRRRPFYPFVTPNVLAGYLAMIIPLTFTPLEILFGPVNPLRNTILPRTNKISNGVKTSFLTGFTQKYSLWLIIPLTLALLLTKSLGALLSIFLGLAIYLYLKGNLKKGGILFLVGLLIIMVGVLISRHAAQKSHTQPIFSAVMRLNYWQDTLRIIKLHPWTGVGLGNFNLVQSRYSHNSYLQVWAEMGILGIIAIFWLIVALIKSSLKTIKDSPDKTLVLSLFTASAVFLMHNFVDFSFFLPEVSFIWWVILGMTLL